MTALAPAVVTATPEETAAIDDVVRRALAEDIGDGDLTGAALLDQDRRCSAVILQKEDGVVAGLSVAAAAFAALDGRVRFEALVADGDQVARGTEVARLDGPAAAIVGAERTALNLLGRLSGIATLTRRYVDAVAAAGATAKVLDTRKTTPGLRALEKLAVRIGGGTNHRRGLYDAIIVKDTHRRLVGGAGEATRRALAGAPPGVEVTIECESLADVRAALAAGADRLLLDNMSPALLADAVRLVAGRAVTEASGGVTLDTVADVARSGVDCISVGALTHSARCLDVSLEVTS